MLTMLSKPSHASAASTRPGGAAPAVESATVLDPAALARLAELDPTGQTQLVRRVLEAFKTSAARLQPQAEAARASGDAAVLRLVAHTLKSSSASIGAMRLSQVCADIEASIRQDGGVGPGERIDAMFDELAGVLRAVAQHLKERG